MSESLRRSQREALARWERQGLALRAEATRQTYVPVVRRFLLEEGVTPGRIERRHVEAHLAKIELLSPASRSRVLCALRSFCGFLARQGRLSKSPVAGLRAPVPEPSHLQLSPRQVGELLRSCEESPTGLRDRALIELLYGGALRRSEACRVLVGDLDLFRGTVLVRRAKRGKPAEVPLPPRALESLKRYLKQGRPLLGKAKTAHLLVVQRGKAMRPSYASTLVKAIGKRVGIEVHAHALRRACATHLVEAGVSLPMVQVLLGHTSLSHTERYVGVSRAALHSAVSALERPG